MVVRSVAMSLVVSVPLLGGCASSSDGPEGQLNTGGVSGVSANAGGRTSPAGTVDSGSGGSTDGGSGGTADSGSGGTADGGSGGTADGASDGTADTGSDGRQSTGGGWGEGGGVDSSGQTTWWKPTADQPIHWHWQLSQEFAYPRDLLPHKKVFDLDGELTSADTVAKLHALGPDVIVICYFDAGVYEDYRSDAASFPREIIGNADTGWDGSYWLDVRQIDKILPLMTKRAQTWCKDKGFDAVEPDETEVWSNESGFPITKEHNIAFNRAIATMVHSLGMSVGLKGNNAEAPDLHGYFDWALTEQCWEFDECELFRDSFVAANKAVFNVEYNVDPNCTSANRWHINSSRRDLGLVGPTAPAYRYTPCIPDTQDTW